MIRFIDIDNGRVYNGDMPYVHWFEGQQSVDLIYVQRICVLTDHQTITASIPENEVFLLLDATKILPENEVVMDHIAYQDLANLSCYSITSNGVEYDGYYIHMLYFVARHSCPMEIRQSFFIDNEEFKIGADFYEEREELKINLDNMGVEIPESIQRAIYPSNVHEEAKDDILMNRKYKELLMDYMDILGTRGNYQSLINSLNWFEYGNLLTLKEFWRHNEWGKTIYSDTELQQILSDKAKSMLVNFAKTTYIGIYCAMQSAKKIMDSNGNPAIEYDKEIFGQKVGDDTLYSARLNRSLPTSQEAPTDILLQHGPDTNFIGDYTEPYQQAEIQRGSNWERNHPQYAGDRFIGEGVPALEKSSYIWSRTDMAIKMALLGNFYETYFMPIHLDLVHSTIEDIVYTNAVKIIPLGKMMREDYVYNLSDVHCNIKDMSVYQLENVSAQACSSTMLATIYKDGEYEQYQSFGVTDVITEIQDEDDLRTFMINYYDGVGVIIPFTFDIKCNAEDLLKHTAVTVNAPSGWQTVDSYKLIAEEDGVIKVQFNLLFTNDQLYDLRFKFDLTDQSITKRIQVVVEDTRRNTLTVYKIKPIYTVPEKYLANDYMFTHRRQLVHGDELDTARAWYSQYIPRSSQNGVQFNHLMVVRNFDKDGNVITNDLEDFLNKCTGVCKTNLTRHYNVFYKYRLNPYDKDTHVTETPDILYYIFISKKFVSEMDSSICRNIANCIKYKHRTDIALLIRDDEVYFPHNHYLEELGGDTLDDYKVTDETLCVVPDIKYLKHITKCEWVFHNASTGEDITLQSVKEPNILPTTYQKLPKGYYDIKFRYLLGHDESTMQEVSLDSAFIQL